jgi:hypothetical protein
MIFINDINIFDEKRKMKAMRKSLRMTTDTFKNSQFIPEMGSVRVFFGTEPNRKNSKRTKPNRKNSNRTEPNRKNSNRTDRVFSKVRIDLISGLFIISLRYDRKLLSQGLFV